MNGKRGRCALCTINKKEIKIMKQFKKLASLLLAAVLAMTLLAGCGGRGGNVDTAVTEQNILKYINESRKAVDRGLSPVKNDPTLAQAAAKLLEEFSKTEMVETNYGTGYKLAETQAESIVQNVTGKTSQKMQQGSLYATESFFYVTPTSYGVVSGSTPNKDLYLLRRANTCADPNDHVYGYGGSIQNFLGDSNIVLARVMKVGIAFREINGERFALVVYDVTLTPAT